MISKDELRGIVEAWKRDTRKPSITVEWSDNIASLIYALVEERAWRLGQFYLCEDWESDPDKNHWRTQAKAELGIADVWLMKEKG